jgi:hypothetical protein
VDRRQLDSRANILAQRDAAMISMIAHGQTLISRLAMLAQVEKEAVLALVVIGESLTEYAHTVRPDSAVMESFEHILESLSPLSAHCTSSPNPMRVMMSYQVGNAEQNDPDEPAMTAEAVSEMMRHILNLKSLHAALVPAQRQPLRTDDVTIPPGTT